jgi:hypothetical protein
MATANKKSLKGAGASKDASNPLKFASLERPDTNQLLSELEALGVSLFDLTIPQQIDKANAKLAEARVDYQKVILAASELVKRKSDEESEEDPAYAAVKIKIFQKKKDLQKEIQMMEKTVEELVSLLPPSIKEQQTTVSNSSFDSSKVNRYPRIYNGDTPSLDTINWIVGSDRLRRYAQEHRLSEEAVIAIAKYQLEIVGPNANADRTIVQFCTHFFNLYNRDGSKHTLFVRQARQLYQLIPDPQGHGRDYDFVESSLIYVNRVEQAIRLSVLVAPAIPPSSEDEEEKVEYYIAQSIIATVMTGLIPHALAFFRAKMRIQSVLDRDLTLEKLRDYAKDYDLSGGGPTGNEPIVELNLLGHYTLKVNQTEMTLPNTMGAMKANWKSLHRKSDQGMNSQGQNNNQSHQRKPFSKDDPRMGQKRTLQGQGKSQSTTLAENKSAEANTISGKPEKKPYNPKDPCTRIRCNDTPKHTRGDCQYTKEEQIRYSEEKKQKRKDTQKR